MSVSASTLRKLALLKLAPDQMAGVLEILADQAQAEEDRKAAQRERTRKHRAKRDGNVTVTSRVCDTPSSPEVSPHTPLPNPSNPIPPSPPKGGSSPAGFDEFWSIYPNKVGKREAEKAFSKAVKRADLATILAGLRRYVAKTDDRPWCNPATWLNQDRWEDRPATVAPAQRATAPPQRERTVSDVLGEIAAGTWTGPQDKNREPDFLTIDASYSRRN